MQDSNDVGQGCNYAGMHVGRAFTVVCLMREQ